MSDFRSRQRIQIHDGIDEFAVTSAKPIYVSLSDGTETVNINASNQMEVSVENTVSISDGGGSISIDDNGGAITVDGTVAATQSGTWDIGTLTGITNDVNIADGGNSITVDGSVTVSATQLDIDSLNKDDDEILIWANTAKDGTGTDYVPLVNSDGRLQVDVVSGGGSNDSVDVDDAAFTVATDSITTIGGVATSDSVDAGDAGALRMLTNRALVTTLEDANGDGIAIDGSGNVAAILAANDGVDIGDVDVASVPAPLNIVGGGVEASALRVTLANDSTGVLTVDDGGTTLSVDDGGGTISIDGTLTGITNDVNIADGGNSITVDGAVTVSATQLDIDDLDHATDSVSIGDGTDTWSIDGSGYGQVDIAAQSLTALKVSKDANANSETNPIFVQVVSTAVSGEEVQDYDTAAAVAKDASDNHDYTVAGTTFLLKSVIVAASGAMKVEIQAGPLASLVTKAVIFTTASKLTEQVFFDPPIEVPVTSTGTVRLIRRNDDNSAMDVYSTIIGNDV